MLVTELPMTTEVSCVREKAELPMLVTEELGMTTEVSCVLEGVVAMLVTELPMTTEVSGQVWNARGPMFVIKGAKVSEVMPGTMQVTDVIVPYGTG